MGLLTWIILGFIAGSIAGVATNNRGEGCITRVAVGILGRIERITDNYLALEIAPNVVIQVQKQAVTQLLPKGTMKGAQ